MLRDHIQVKESIELILFPQFSKDEQLEDKNVYAEYQSYLEDSTIEELSN